MNVGFLNHRPYSGTHCHQVTNKSSDAISTGISMWLMNESNVASLHEVSINSHLGIKTPPSSTNWKSEKTHRKSHKMSPTPHQVLSVTQELGSLPLTSRQLFTSKNGSSPPAARLTRPVDNSSSSNVIRQRGHRFTTWNHVASHRTAPRYGRNNRQKGCRW